MLKKAHSFSFSYAHISLAFIGLMWVLPFLYYRHAYPLTTFYQEWGAALLGLCAMPLLLTARYWQSPEVPRTVMLPIGLMLLLMLQFFLGIIPELDLAMLLGLYFLFAALLIMLGRQLREELGLPLLVTALSVFLLTGAELNMLAGVLQHYRWHTFLSSVITAKTSDAVYGNLAQPNHYADYLALGLISLGLLYVRYSMRIWLVALLAAPLLFVMALSGSRSSWLYMLVVAGLAWLWQRHDRALRPLLNYLLVLLAGFGLMQLVVQLPWLQGVGGSVTTAERLFGDVGSGHIRLHLWREAALILEKFPLLGAGFGQFAYQHMLLAPELKNPAIVGLYNNAHNLVMQIGAEAGLAGLAILLGTIVQWLRRSVIRNAQFSLYHWWGYAILLVLGIHSLLEYPLWYAHFLGVAALTLGIFDRDTYRLELRLVGRVAVALMLLMGALLLAQAFRDYRQLEFAAALRASREQANVTRAQSELLELHQSPLFSSYAELYIASTMEISPAHLQQKLELNERALRFIPIPQVVYHEAWLLALADRPVEAKAQLERAIWGYPDNYSNALIELRDLVAKDPARFSPLLEFATQKHEEYRSAAVPAK